MCVMRKDIVAVGGVVVGGGEDSITEGSFGGAIEGGVAEPIEEMFIGVAGGGLMAKGGK